MPFVLDSGHLVGSDNGVTGEIIKVPQALPTDSLAFLKPFSEYTVCELMLTLIFTLLCIKLVLELFTKKWGFFDW
ncbi:MAG: hypothetical protein RR115_02185 [Hydrogenoanaerobacterium sp.]